MIIQPELSREIEPVYHTVFMARYDNKLCGSYGKYYTPKLRSFAFNADNKN